MLSIWVFWVIKRNSLWSITDQLAYPGKLVGYIFIFDENIVVAKIKLIWYGTPVIFQSFTNTTKRCLMLKMICS